MTPTEPSEPRQVSDGLALGIFFSPIVFAWLVLRRGYSAKARALSFGWLTVTLASGVYVAWTALSARIEYQCSVLGTGATTCDFTNYGHLSGAQCVRVNIRRDHLLGGRISSVNVCSGSVESRGTRRAEALMAAPFQTCLEGKPDLDWTKYCYVEVEPIP